MNFYDSLGLSPCLTLDSEELKKRFYDRSRQWHPDRFGRAGEAGQKQALDMTSALNDAFRTLRDPVSRAEYFLHESGLDPSKNPPPELLEEVFEMNMALEELRGGDESVRGQLDSSRERFTSMLSEIDASLTDLFQRYDASGDRAVLEEIRAVLDRRRYVSNLLRDAAQELAAKELNVHLSN